MQPVVGCSQSRLQSGCSPVTPAGNQSQRREIMLLSVGKSSLLIVHDKVASYN